MNGHFQTPQRTYGKRPFRDDDPASSARSFRRRGNEDFPATPGSFRRGGGRGRDEGAAPIRPVDRFRQDLWKFGDEDSPAFGIDSQSLLAAAKHAEDMFNRYRDDLSEGFKIAVTELPHKLHHYACILSLMDRKPAASLVREDESNPPSAGHAIVGYLIKSFQNDLLDRKWRDVRLYLQFFAILASLPRPLISATSLIEVVKAFAAVSEEFGVGANRADEAAHIALDALARLSVEADVDAVLTMLRTYIESRRTARTFLYEPDQAQQYDDPIETHFNAYSDGGRISVQPTPHEALAEQMSDVGNWTSTPHDLPTIVVPLDVETESTSTYTGTRVELRLFDDDTVPARDSTDGSYLRGLVDTVIQVFEVNRREAAKYLLELPRWLAPTTFKPKAGAKVETDAEHSSTWILEHVVVETILSALFTLPAPHYSPAYCAALIIELCKLSPATVAPAMGKCVRRIYAGLGEAAQGDALAIDAEGARRFAEWFSVHLSNFSYNWRWAEWQEGLTLPVTHPKRAIIDRILDLEIRLSYFDRIKEPLPEPYKEATILNGEAPGPSFAFDSPEHPQHAAATHLTEMLRSKASVEDLRSELRVFRETLQEQGYDGDLARASTELTIQCILSVGSRSFSHLLNAFERYIELLRELGGTTESRRHILEQVFAFWRRNPQFLVIVVDKLLQYRVIEYSDVLDYLFAEQPWSGFVAYDLLQATLARSQSRIGVIKARLDATEPSESDKLQEQYENAQKDADSALVHAARGIATLVDSLDTKMEDNGSWTSWWIRGWYREFSRAYVVRLGEFHDRLKTAIPANSAAQELLIEGSKRFSDFVGRA